MKTTLFLLFFLSVNITNCQNNYDQKLVEEVSSISILEAPFMIEELVEIYKKDTLIIKRSFNKKIFDRTKYTLYCYNVCANYFYDRLMDKRNSKNEEVIDKIISDLNYDKDVTKPDIDWGKVFETCQTCPFGEYPDDRFFYFQFSVMFMGENEIKEMIEFSNGEQWKYALMAIKGGDAFALNKEGNYKQYVLDRRMASYIIEKWKDSKIPEVQELVATYKSVM